MNLVKTKSFTLAVNTKGDKNASKTAILLPGKLDTKDYANFVSHQDYLAGKGFFTVAFDPPGTWKSPGDISLYSMTNYLKAINELIEYFGNKPTFVVGHSRGASMAILAAIKNPNIFAFASIFPSLSIEGKWERSDAEKWKKQGYLVSRRDLPPGGGEKSKIFRLPYAFYEDQFKYNAEGLDKLDKPKLFFFGNRDDMVKSEEVKKLFDFASQPKEIYELNSDHDYRLHPKLIEKVNTALGKFIDKYHII